MCFPLGDVVPSSYRYIKTFGMFLGRIVFFRLHESPRYLVHAGRKQDALESLQMISRFNGSELELDLEDVEDHIRVPSHLPDSVYPTENGPPSSRLFDVDAEILSSPTEIKGSSTLAHAGTPLSSTPPDGAEGTSSKDYSATGGSGAPLAAYAVVSSATERRSFVYQSTPVEQTPFPDVPPSPKEEEIPTENTYVVPRPRSRSRSSRVTGGPRRRDTISSVRSSFYEAADRAYWALPRSIRRPMRAWLSRFVMVLEPEWRRTTVLVWGAWWGIMLGFTMFNVYLPKLLETRREVKVAEITSLERTLWDVAIFTIGGCPGAVVRFFSLSYPVYCFERVFFLPLFWRRITKIIKLGAWLIERPGLGRKMSLVGSTWVTAMLCLGFVLVQHPVAVTATTVGISLSSSVRGFLLIGMCINIKRVNDRLCGLCYMGTSWIAL